MIQGIRWPFQDENEPWQAGSKERELHSYNCKELNSVNNLNDLENGLVLRVPQEEHSCTHTLIWL